MNFKVKNLVLSGALLALTFLLSSIFHMTGINGSIFSPMHLPVLLAGFIVGPFLGFLVGLLAPLLSFLINGMPQIPMLFIMMAELSVYGLLTGFFYKYLRVTILPSLVFSMIIGRLVGGVFSYLLAALFGFEKFGFITFLQGAIITAWPAIVIQIILVPILVKVYYRRNKGASKYMYS